MPSGIDELHYELNVSPRSSLASLDIKINAITRPPPQPTPRQPLTPSIRLLFSLVPRRHFFILLLPAILSSLASGGIAPFMTLVVGQTFDAFANFPTSSATPEEKSTLLHQVGISCLELIALAVGSIALGSLTSCLWIWVGEMNAMSVRKTVYQSVIEKEMSWFDQHLSTGEQQAEADNANDPLGAGGLMAKFARFVLHTYFSFTVLSLSTVKQTMLGWPLP